MLFIDANDAVYIQCTRTYIYFTVDDSDWKTGSLYIYRVKLRFSGIKCKQSFVCVGLCQRLACTLIKSDRLRALSMLPYSRTASLNSIHTIHTTQPQCLTLIYPISESNTLYGFAFSLNKTCIYSILHISNLSIAQHIRCLHIALV